MSRIDDFVTSLATAFEDSTVNFVAGRLNINRHSTRRQAIFVRMRGSLQWAKGPGRQPHGTITLGAGTTTTQRFTREETIEVTLRAEDEEALDALFDRMVNTIFEVAGPNAFEARNEYQWIGEDSRDANAWDRRNVGLKFMLNLRLASRSDARDFAQIADTSATVSLEDSDVTVTVPSA